LPISPLSLHDALPISAAVSPGELVDPSTVATDFMMRQHLQGDYGDDEIAFDAVVQKQGDTLLVLVLTPYGSRALLIEQKGLNTRDRKSTRLNSSHVKI